MCIYRYRQLHHWNIFTDCGDYGEFFQTYNQIFRTEKKKIKPRHRFRISALCVLCDANGFDILIYHSNSCYFFIHRSGCCCRCCRYLFILLRENVDLNLRSEKMEQFVCVKANSVSIWTINISNISLYLFKPCQCWRGYRSWNWSWFTCMNRERDRDYEYRQRTHNSRAN